MPISTRPDRDRRVRQHARMARVLRILNLIQSRGRWNAKTIAEELECSERTVYRDLEVLDFAGVPWFYSEEDKCYRVRSDYHFPVLNLTEEELSGQAVAAMLSQVPGLEITNGALETTRKLAATLDADGQELLQDCRRLLGVLAMKLVDHGKHLPIIQTAQMALRTQQRLTGHYSSPYEDKPCRIDIHPYRLCLIKRAWYLIGLLAGESEPKTLRINRFKSLRISGNAAAIPDSFSLAEYLGNAWGVYRGERTCEVKLRFSGNAARVVPETT